MSRFAAASASIDARCAARKAADAERRRTAALRRRRAEGRRYRLRHVGKRIQRGLLDYHRTLASLPPDLADAYRTATPQVRRLIIDQARDDATRYAGGGVSLEYVLKWKALA